MPCPECGCDWPPCENGCVTPLRFRLWRFLHPVAYRKARSLNSLVHDLIAEHGKPSADDYDWADRVLGHEDHDG